MQFKDFTINILLGAVFLIAMFSFGVGIATNYGVQDGFIDDEQIDYTALSEAINSTNTQAKLWEESFKSDNIFIQLGAVVLFSVWGIIQLVWGAGFTIINVIFQGAYNVLGIPPMITGSIISIVIISLIFSVWRLIKQGE